MLLEAWRDYEDAYGNDSSRAAVENLMPKRVKKRRRIQTQDRVGLSFEHSVKEEYFNADSFNSFTLFVFVPYLIDSLVTKDI